MIKDMTEKLILDERLGFAAELVPVGSVLLDVGTDHGYLPVRLLLDGKISHAGAADINVDPLQKALNTGEKYGVSDQMTFYLSDGLNSIRDLERYTAVSICGMGGELISRIIERADYLRENRIPLILQPMSSAEELSEYLADKGFAITDERIAFAAGKVYRVILAEYDGVVRSLTPVEHILGRINLDIGAEQKNFDLLIKKYILKYGRMIDGKRLGGVDCHAEQAILDELCRIAQSEGIDYENS